MKHSFLLFLLFITGSLSAQSFLNTDLNGYIGISSLPFNWQFVPYTESICYATSYNTATSDITGLTGPMITHGINGNPQSGNTFVSGLFGNAIGTQVSQEGLQQTVPGFTVGCTYTILFYQTVVKQINFNFLDTSGVWRVYLDSTLISTTAPTISQAVYNSNALTWESRSVTFTATNTTHTIKFLPYDDDTDSTSNGQGGRVRMGIDSIYLIPAIPNLLENDTTICPGDTLTMDVTNQSATYLWQDGSTNPTFNITTNGTYWVQISTSCATTTDTIHITQIPPPILNLGIDTTLCQGEQITLAAVHVGYSKLWQDNSTDTLFTVTQQGTYWVELSNQCGTVSDTINVNYTPLPMVDLGTDIFACIGDTITLSSSVTNANYLWSDSSTDSTLNVHQSGNYWVQVTQNGCSKNDAINVTFYANPFVNLGADSTLCQGDSVVLDASSNNYSYAWQDNSTGNTFTVNSTGLYSVTVEENNCYFSDSIQLNFNPLPIVYLGNDTALCLGDSLTLNASGSNYSYLWNDLTTNASIQVFQAGTYWVNVQENNCYAADTVQVSYLNLPIVNLGSDTTICEGQNLLLTVTQPSYTYLWQDNSSNSTLLVHQSGTYWVEVKENNCVASDTINISMQQLPVINLGNDTTLCFNDSLLLDASHQNSTYIWQNNTSNPWLLVSTPGTYWINVFDGHCTGMDTIQVTYNPNPTVYLGEDVLSCKGEEITLDATHDNYSYLWSDQSINPTLLTNQAGVYWVRVSENNCFGFDTIQVETEVCVIILQLPNIITPNNDGINEIFTPKKIEGVVAMQTIIYDRWGNIVLETDDIHINWTGVNNSDGTYFWTIKYWGEDLVTKTKKGTVTLIR